MALFQEGWTSLSAAVDDTVNATYGALGTQFDVKSSANKEFCIFTSERHKGPYLNDVYTEGEGGFTKCRRSKGGCVDLVL